MDQRKPENTWKAWALDRDLEKKYFVSKLIDDEDGLRLHLVCTGNEKKITLRFPGMVYAYRNRLELAALRTLGEVTEQGDIRTASDWTFFIIENSTFSKEIAEESQDIYPFSQLIHFAVAAGQVLVEVITDAIPTLSDGWE